MPRRPKTRPDSAPGSALAGAPGGAPVPPSPAARFRPALLALLAAAIAFGVFVPALDNEFVDWDDKGVLLDHEAWRGLGPEQLRWMFTTNHYGHYQPFTWITYGLDYEIWEMNPRGYHLTNNLFHALNTALVFALSLGLLRRALPGPAREWAWLVEVAALFATLLFAVHPLRVESVAWATERRDLVSACFILLTLLTWLRSTRSPGWRRWAWLAVSLVIYVVSMMSKVGGAPLPVVLIVLDWYPLRRLGPGLYGWLGPRGLGVLLEKLPYFVVAVGFAVATIGQQTGRWLYPLELHSLVARCAQAFYGLVFYAWKTVWPSNLLPLYELHTPLDPFATTFIVSAVIVLAVAVAFLLLARRCPGALAAGLCYAAMLGPLLGFFQNGPQIVADRYSYLSTLGWVILLAGGAVWLLDRRRASGGGRGAGGLGVVAGGLGGAAVVTLAVLTVRQCDVWETTASLWTYMIERDPDSHNANNSYGYVLLSAGRVDESVPHFRRALEIDPEKNHNAWYNLWNALNEAGRDEELRQALDEGATSGPTFDIRADACHRLGNIEYADRNNEAAARWFGRSLQLRERYAEAHVNLALTLNRLGRPAEAERHARRAVELERGLRQAWTALAASLGAQELYHDAIAAARVALQIDPGNAYAKQLISNFEARLNQRN